MDDDLFSVGVIWEALQKPPAESSTSRTQLEAESTGTAVHHIAKSSDVNGNTIKALKCEDVELKKEVKTEVFKSSKMRIEPQELTKLSLKPGGSARVKVEEGKSAPLPGSKESGPSDIVAEACKYQQALSNLSERPAVPPAINSNSWCAPNQAGVQIYHEKIFIPHQLMHCTEVTSKLIGPQGSFVNHWRTSACSVLVRGRNPYRQTDYCRNFPGNQEPLHVCLTSLTPEARAMCSEMVKDHINNLWYTHGRVCEPVVHRVSLDTVGAGNPGKGNVSREQEASSNGKSRGAVETRTLDVRPEEPAASEVGALGAAFADNPEKDAGVTSPKPVSPDSLQKQLPEDKPDRAHVAGGAHFPPEVENANSPRTKKRIDFEKSLFSQLEQAHAEEPGKKVASMRNFLTRLLNYIYDVIVRSPNLDDLFSDRHDDADFKDINEELKSAVKKVHEALSRALNVMVEVDAMRSQLAHLVAAQELEETTEIPAILQELRILTLKKMEEYCRPI